MSVKVVFCVLVGHRWTEASDVHEPFPVLLCTRCRREQDFGAETSAPEGWMERGNRSARAHDLMDARIQRRR